MAQQQQQQQSQQQSQQRHQQSQQRRHRGPSFLTSVLVLSLCCLGTVFISIFYHGMTLHGDHHNTYVENNKNRQQQLFPASGQSENYFDQQLHRSNSIATKKYSNNQQFLSCERYGGPSREIAQEMIYWKDIPRDQISPLVAFENSQANKQRDLSERKYLTFEPDGGGWNNIRMSMETVMAMAAITGRTLVLPPSQHMYLLYEGSRTFSFADFFPLDEFSYQRQQSSQLPVLEIMSTEEFLRETNGTLTNRKTNQISFPPKMRMNWDGDTQAVSRALGPYLQSIAYTPDWDPGNCVAVFPQRTSSSNSDLSKGDQAQQDQMLKEMFHSIVQEHGQYKQDDIYAAYINHPTPVNGTLFDRMKEFMAGRKDICLYNFQMEQERIIHFHGKRTMGGRLLVHFYAFLFSEAWQIDLWMKRFVRDQLRYKDEIQCAAARIVHAIRERSKSKNNGGIYDSFHIRRGDFQYKKTRVDADIIYERAKAEIPDGTTVYIATDEKPPFFKDMADHWDVVFLSDYQDLVQGIDPNYYGMIDQLVASRGRTFFGCWFSTFTGYINRLRGYHSIKERAKGYELGLLLNSFYYALPQNKYVMNDYWPIKQAFYAREFPASWRDIDLGVVEAVNN